MKEKFMGKSILVTTITTLTLLTTRAKQSETETLKEFTISKFAKGSIDTTKPLASQPGGAPTPTSTSTHTGTFHSDYDPGKKLVQIRFFYRETGNNQFNTTKILKIKFPYNIEGKYTSKDLAYSTTAASDFQLVSDGVEHLKIDDELYIFSDGEVEGEQYNLLSIFTNL